MAHVTLIHPPTILNMDSLSYNNSIPPLGLAYMSAATKKAGHQVTIVDSPGEAIEDFHPIKNVSIKDLYIHGLTPDEIVERIPENTEIVGITHMFLHAWPVIRDLIKKIKEAHPHQKLVMGGETPSAWWQYMMKELQEIDFCVVGEGEYTFIDMLECFDKDTPFSEVANLVYRDKGVPKRSLTKRKRIREINELSWPDWEAFDIDAYLDRDYSSGVNRGRSMPMLATRGCPYQCTFCSSPDMWTTRYVTRNTQDVVDEIGHYIKHYNADNIDFLDLTAIVKRQWVLDFCEKLLEQKINITWQLPSGTRSEVIDQEVVEALYKSGCRNISYAPESGSPAMLQKIKKRVDLDNIVDSMKGAVDAGLVTNANIILGLPGDTWKDVWLSYKLGLRLACLGLHSLALMIFAPYPGSNLFNMLRKEGKISYDDDYFYSAFLRTGKTTVSYNNFSPKTLIILQFIFLCSFWGIQYLLRPVRLVKTLMVFLTNGREEYIMDNFLRTKKFYMKQRKLAKSPIFL